MSEPTLVLVSDALGETVEQVAQAAMKQFASRPSVKRFFHITSLRDLEPVVAFLQDHRPSCLLYTVVLEDVRVALHHACREAGVFSVDIMGPALGALRSVLPGEPSLTPGLTHRLDEAYFQRVAAVEFAVRADDGKDPASIVLADVVLLGVSRTSKTPLSMYLANRRVKAANVPIVPEAPVPLELYRVPATRLVGLTVKPELLVRIRQERVRAMGLPPEIQYAALGRIVQELEYADGLFRELGCRVVDVSDRAVEETAGQIIDMLSWNKHA